MLKNGGRETLECQDIRSNTLSDWLVETCSVFHLPKKSPEIPVGM